MEDTPEWIIQLAQVMVEYITEQITFHDGTFQDYHQIIGVLNLLYISRQVVNSKHGRSLLDSFVDKEFN